MARSKKSLKKIQSLIFLMLITLVFGITATYAWFSTQRTVEIAGMRLNVEVAESLQISLDGEVWSQSINIADMRQFYGTYQEKGTETFAVYQAKKVADGGNQNYVPTELFPVSTAGEVASGKLKFVQGTVANNVDGTQSLTGITACTEADITTTADVEDKEDNNELHPYFVFDMYLRNISAKTTGIDELELDEGSRIFINTATTDDTEQEGKGQSGTGLEYSARVGFVIYGNTVSVTAQDDATLGTVGEQIRGIPPNNSEVAAIWEPNFKEHTQYVVNNNGRGITSTSQTVTTYGIKSAVAEQAEPNNTITNINSTTDTNLVAVKTFKPSYTLAAGTTAKKVITDTAGSNIGLQPNKISRVRVYIWLEGQDPDCVDMASTGDKLNVNLKLIKETNTTNENTYVPGDEPLAGAVETAGTDGEFKYVQLENGEIQITRYVGSSTNVVIPATYDGYTVYSVGNVDATDTSTERYNIFGASNSTTNTTITSVTISEGIEKIKMSAFNKCTGLRGTVTLPSTLTEIESFAFNGCSALTGNLSIPEGVTTIGTAAFQNCTGLNGILTLPSTLQEIEEYAFHKCSNLTGDINIPEGVTTIGRNAFYNCSKLTGDLNIPEGVTTIGQSTFNKCSGLNGNLMIPEGVTTIGNYAFSQCSSLTGDLSIPEGVTTIGEAAFQGCSGLHGILTLPSTLMGIGDFAFNHCTNLTNTRITIPSSVEIIGSNATDGSHVFYDNSTKTLTEYKMAGESSEFKVIDGVLFNKSGTRLIAYPPSKIGNTYEIPEGVTIIDEMGFSQAGSTHSGAPENGLKKIILPNSYILTTTLPENYNLNGRGNNLVAGIWIYTGIEEVEVKADNPNYKSVDGIVYSKDGTTLWYVPTAKTGNIIIEEGVTTIKTGAFCGEKWTSIKIPASVTTIEESFALEILEDLGSSVVTFDANCIYEFKADGTIGKKE